MTVHLDLADIQCNVLRPTEGFPKARFFAISIPSDDDGMPIGKHGRDFVMAYREKVTTAVPWYLPAPQLPKVAINLAFSWEGLRYLELPVRTLAEMPAEFIAGMEDRIMILGDQPKSLEDCKPKDWEEPWTGKKVHILVAIQAQMDPSTGQPVPELQQETQFLIDLCKTHNLEIIDGHAGIGPQQKLRYQEATAHILKLPNGTFIPTRQEHFGFSDGIGQPVFEGQYGKKTDEMAQGSGKLTQYGKWEPLATGEFLLGHPDEAQEIPGASMPPALVRNGTFLVYRKLHQNVGSFNAYIDKAATAYAATQPGLAVPDAREIIMAKMAGRWSDGVPLSVKPTLKEWRDFQKSEPNPEKRIELSKVFSYRDDPQGVKCPIGAHLRRVNTRDSLDVEGDLGSALNNRRRLLRRGLPYGEGPADDQSDHGVIMLAMCASIARQFEFVQQQWIQYGLDASAGNDDCPLLGSRADGNSKFVIPVDPESGDAPFICSQLPKFVESRGGEYFFVPSMTALRMIGMGVVDPT